MVDLHINYQVLSAILWSLGLRIGRMFGRLISNNLISYYLRLAAEQMKPCQPRACSLV
jgi:hypothetical protein